MDLREFDVILVNTSAGKDSLAMLDYVVALADAQGVRDRVKAVHCDLGRVEWSGTRELAERQCAAYGVPLTVVSRAQDLLAQVEQRGMWPSPTVRYCTSDHKRDQVAKVMTAIVDHIRRAAAGKHVRILNCMGLRAQESDARKKLAPVAANKRASNTKRTVVNWLPIHDWTEEQVWNHIRARGLEYHPAYDLGMPRLSCVFCFFAPPEALLLAGYHNRALLGQYVGVERRTGHTFKSDLSLVQIEAQLDAGYVPAQVDGRLWKQCA